MSGFLRMLVVALLFTTGVSHAQQRAPGGAENAKHRDIRALLALSGAEHMATQIMHQVVESVKTDRSKVPEKFWKDFLQVAKPNELTDRLVPIYDKYFTHEDIKSLIQFYQSPIGQKMIKVQPQIAQDSFQVGEEWGEQLEEKLEKKLQQQGYQ